MKIYLCHRNNSFFSCRWTIVQQRWNELSELIGNWNRNYCTVLNHTFLFRAWTRLNRRVETFVNWSKTFYWINRFILLLWEKNRDDSHLASLSFRTYYVQLKKKNIVAKTKEKHAPFKLWTLSSICFWYEKSFWCMSMQEVLGTCTTRVICI